MYIYLYNIYTYTYTYIFINQYTLIYSVSYQQVEGVQIL